MSAPTGSFSRYNAESATSAMHPTISSGSRPKRSIIGAAAKREDSVLTMKALAQKAATAAGAWYTVSA